MSAIKCESFSASMLVLTYLVAVLTRSAHERVISHSSPSDGEEAKRRNSRMETYVSEGEQNKLPHQTLSAIMRCLSSLRSDGNNEIRQGVLITEEGMGRLITDSSRLSARIIESGSQRCILKYD